MENLSQKRISANLRRWADKGLDHKNPAHVSAYLLARQQSTRPTPSQILAILGQSQVSTASTARLTTEFMLVPKGNFGGDAPGWLQEFLVPESELRRNYRVPAHSDFSAVFVVDPSCPAERLGKRVARMAFEQTFSQTLTAEGSADAPPSPTGEDEADYAVLPDTTSVHPRSGSSLGTESSSSGTATAPVRPAEGPPSKKQRVLKLLVSEEHLPSEEVEAQTLEDLIQRIKKAAKSKLLYSEDPANSATVHFWCKQAVLAFKALGHQRAGLALADNPPWRWEGGWVDGCQCVWRQRKIPERGLRGRSGRTIGEVEKKGCECVWPGRSVGRWVGGWVLGVGGWPRWGVWRAVVVGRLEGVGVPGGGDVGCWGLQGGWRSEDGWRLMAVWACGWR